MAAIEAIRDNETLTALIGALVRATGESEIRAALAAARNGELYDE